MALLPQITPQPWQYGQADPVLTQSQILQLGLGPPVRTAVGDVNYPIATTDRYVALNAITAARTWTLPPAATYPVGTGLVIDDLSGKVSPFLTLTIVPNGVETINGGANIQLAQGNARAILYTDGVNKWTAVQDSQYPNVSSQLIWAHFVRNPSFVDLLNLYISTSVDGITWTTINNGSPVWTPDATDVQGMRDPSIALINGVYYCVFTRNAGTSASSFGLLRSTDLIHWTNMGPVSPTGIGALTFLYAPEFFVDTDGSIHVIFAGSTTNNTTGFSIYRITASNVNLSAWGAASAMTGITTGVGYIDPCVFKNAAGTYYVFVDKNSAGYDIWSSSSIGSGYTQLTSYLTPGQFLPVEGATLLPLPNGAVRLYCCTGNSYVYNESFDGTLLKWTNALAGSNYGYPLNLDSFYQHGSIIRVPLIGLPNPTAVAPQTLAGISLGKIDVGNTGIPPNTPLCSIYEPLTVAGNVTSVLGSVACGIDANLVASIGSRNNSSMNSFQNANASGDIYTLFGESWSGAIGSSNAGRAYVNIGNPTGNQGVTFGAFFSGGTGPFTTTITSNSGAIDFRPQSGGAVLSLIFNFATFSVPVVPNASGSLALGASNAQWKQIFMDNTVTAAGSTGAKTINKEAGTIRIAAAGTTVVLTNSLIVATSKVQATLCTVDGTAKTAVAVCAAGSCTFTLNAAATGEVEILWRIVIY